ncbi:MAG: hypothetical protein JWP47_2589 [Polaromonas sp.]|nr:hypothetical protein [Polaromonas sp.]
MTSVLLAPRFWVLTTAAVVVGATTFSLGQWQLRRAAEKENVQTLIDAKKILPALDNSGLVAIKNGADLIYRQARLQGSWLQDHTVYLDNRPMNGKSGFIAVTPFKLEGQTSSILVQRGWVPRNFQNRAAVPQITSPAGLVTIQGRISQAPSKLYAFDGAESGRIRQNLDLPIFAAETGLPLLSVTLVQTGPSSEGLLRDWAAARLGVEKNYGYAFQWFGLCALTVFLYVWFQVVQPWRLQKQSLPTP